MADFTKPVNLPFTPNQNLILLAERQLKGHVREKKMWYLSQLIRRKPKAILPFFPPLTVSYVLTRKWDSSVNGKAFYILEATIFFCLKA